MTITSLYPFLLIVPSTLGYSEFYGTGARAVALFIYGGVLLKHTIFHRADPTPIGYASVVFYFYFALNLIGPYVGGALTEFRFFYLLLYPLAIYGAFILGGQFEHEKLASVLYYTLILLFAVGAYQLFSANYVHNLTFDGNAFSNPEKIMAEDIPWYVRRVSSLVGNSNAFGVLMVFFALFNLFSREKFVKYGSIVLMFIAVIFMAKSRSAVVTALFVVALHLWYQKRHLSVLTLAFCFAALVLVIAPYILSDPEVGTFFRFTDGDWGADSYYQRLSVNHDALRIWFSDIRYLLLGAGYDCESYALAEYNAFALYTESVYTKLPLELGLAGLSLLIAFFAISLGAIIKRVRHNNTGNVFTIFVIAWLFYGLMETAALMPSVALPLAIMCGSMLSTRPIS
jgi:hypothetical protein